MYGVLLALDSEGRRHVLKAFSGKLDGTFHHPGWAPPLLELEPTVLELETKERLAELKSQLQALGQERTLEELEAQTALWLQRKTELFEGLQGRREQRRELRKNGASLEALEAESKEDSRQKREFKALMKSELEPLRRAAKALSEKISALKSQRRQLSRTLQAELHHAFAHALWSDRPWSLASLFPSGPPTGTGECCAPKLLHWAQQLELRPVAMAEIWWGPATRTRTPGHFYPPCVERCRPLLGALLSPARFKLQKHYEDAHFLALEKPSGLLTVPGRQGWNQDSLQLRAEKSLGTLYPIHRLDLETSGIVLFAKSAQAQSELQKQFAKREVCKVYRARLLQRVSEGRGEISLALGPDPQRQGSYCANPEGKTALTEYRCLDAPSDVVEFRPLTGRSHQLRVHAAQGLGAAIRGDRLYGNPESTERLHLHAQKLEFSHPFREERVQIESEVPF